MEAEKEGLKHSEAFQSSSSTNTPNGNNTNGNTAAATNSAALALLSGSNDSSSKALVKADDSSKQDNKDSSSSRSDVAGQEVDLVFIAPKAATYSLNLVVMSDCWIGVDETLQVNTGRGSSILLSSFIKCCSGWPAPS